MAENKIVLEDLVNLKDGTTIDVEAITNEIDPAYALVREEADDFAAQPIKKIKTKKNNFYSQLPSTNLKLCIDKVIKAKNTSEERLRKHLQFEFDMKMKRISRIKSKTYRRLRKREKIRKEMELENSSEEEIIQESTNSEEKEKIKAILEFNNSEEEVSENEQQQIINEAFSNDEEVNEIDFLREKEKIVKNEAPQIIETVLPGWNDWAGKGIKETVKTKSNSKIELKEGIKISDRKDFSNKNVIINENIKIPEKYQSELPYGYSVQAYKDKLKTPVSLEATSLRAFHRLVKTVKKDETIPGKNIEPEVFEPEY